MECCEYAPRLSNYRINKWYESFIVQALVLVLDVEAIEAIKNFKQKQKIFGLVSIARTILVQTVPCLLVKNHEAERHMTKAVMTSAKETLTEGEGSVQLTSLYLLV
jgi:hypothetical protein